MNSHQLKNNEMMCNFPTDKRSASVNGTYPIQLTVVDPDKGKERSIGFGKNLHEDTGCRLSQQVAE